MAIRSDVLEGLLALRSEVPAGVAFRAEAGEPSNKEIKDLVEQGNKAYHEFKQQAEKRLEELEKNGVVSAETQENLDRINNHMDQILDAIREQQDQKERVSDLEAQLNRGGFGGTGSSGFTDEQVARFNALLRDPAGGEPGVNAKQMQDYKAALLQAMRRGDKGITPDVHNELSVGVDPNGGYWVTPDMEGRVAEFLYETSNVRSEASVQPISTGSLQGDYDLDEAGFGWVGEYDSRSETSTPDIGEWEIFAHEMYAEPRATQQLLDDAAVDVEAWLIDKLRRRFRRAEESAFVTGNGVKKPRGFLDYTMSTSAPTGSDFEKIEYAATGASGDFNGTDPANIFLEIQGRLKTGYRGNAVWAMNRTTMAEARKLQDGQGAYLLVPNFANPGEQMMLGHPVREWDDMPDIAADSFSIAFGDFREGYQIVDRTGMRLLRDPYTSKGKVKFYGTRRVGGGVVNFEALKLIKFAS
jgi:HK97 family phage major capsid protein